MPVLEGLEDAGREIGYQEKAITDFVEAFLKSHENIDGYASLLLSLLVSIAQNIDMQNKRGREISRNVASMLDLIRQLHDWDAQAQESGDELPEETRRLLEEMKL